MAMNSRSPIYTQTPIRIVFKTWILISLYASLHAQGARPSTLDSIPSNGVFSSLSSPETPFISLSPTEDTAVVSAKNLSPEVLATPMPVSALLGKGNAESQLKRKQLFLRSSLHNISGIGGYPLYALPIFSTDLVGVLSKTEADLQTRTSQTFASSYQYSTNKWSFSVILANTTLPYTSIQAVVKRFLKLSSTIRTPESIVSTRVGVIFKGNIAIADIVIVPRQIISNSSFVPFSNFGQHKNFSESQPIEIAKITPFGSSCAYQIVNETAALAPFQGYNSIYIQNLTTRSLETEILVRVGQTAFDMTLYLWQREDGLPIEVKVWILKSLLYVASLQISAAALLSLLEFEPFGDLFGDGSFDADTGLDTGFFVLGRLVGRFVVRLIATAIHIMSLSIWKEILAALLRPLQAMSAQASAWAMEGEIYGPDVLNDSYVVESEGRKGGVVARWQMWVGDNEE